MVFIGNKKAVATLSRSLEKGSLNHAYLFCGPEKLGKFSLAKSFALSAISGKSLQDGLGNEDKEALLDLIILKPEVVEKKGISKQRDISVEQVREAKQSLSLFPYHGKYKILVIDDAHRLNVAAQNALLKILEEPNPTTIIILVTSEYERILSTIVSRVQLVNFSLVDEKQMQEAFFQEEVVGLSSGRPGLAMVLASDDLEKELHLEAATQQEKISKSSLNEKFSLAEEYSKDVVKTLRKLNIWIWQLRKNALKNETDIPTAYAKIEKIQNCMDMLKRTNANSRLLLETLLMDL